MKIGKKIALALATIGLIGVIGLAGLFTYHHTDNPFLIKLFKVGYELAPSKHNYLHFYSPQRRDVGAGYLPQEVDQFLCKKIEATTDEHEFDAIVNLYVLQAGGREGGCIYLTSDSTREKIAASIVENFGEAVYDLYPQIVLLEEIRLGKSLGKGNIGASTLETRKPSSPAEWKAWTEGAMPIVRSKYLEWWTSGKTWDEKKKLNPLEGTIARVNECCG